MSKSKIPPRPFKKAGCARTAGCRAVEYSGNRIRYQECMAAVAEKSRIGIHATQPLGSQPPIASLFEKLAGGRCIG